MTRMPPLGGNRQENRYGLSRRPMVTHCYMIGLTQAALKRCQLELREKNTADIG